MTNVLVTGGNGHLGHQVVINLVEMGYTTHIMSRHQQPDSLLPGTRWAQADITTGQGVAEAVAGMDVLIHTATDPSHSKQIDVDGTQLVLEKAREAGIAHVLYISIVGIDRIPYSYYQHKTAAEEIIEHSGIPWSVLRATQFHSLVNLLLQMVTKVPLAAIVPTDFKAQTVDESEVAKRLCETVRTGPSGRLPDFGGPQVLTLGEMTKTWLKARGMRRVVLPLWIPGTIAKGFRSSSNTCPKEQLHGHLTWSEWLQKHYDAEGDAKEESIAAQKGEEYEHTF